MPSERKQFNVRLSEEGEARLQRCRERLYAIRGGDVSQADVMERALVELEEYLDWRDQATKTRQRKRKE